MKLIRLVSFVSKRLDLQPVKDDRRLFYISRLYYDRIYRFSGHNDFDLYGIVNKIERKINGKSN